MSNNDQLLNGQIDKVMASLDEPFQSFKVPSSLKEAIVESLWGPEALPKHLSEGEAGIEPRLDLYFRYYSNQCRIIALHEGGRYASVKTHRDIAKIVQLLKEPLTREALNARILGSDAPNDTRRGKCDGSINLAARILLMIEFGNLPYAFSGHKQLIWEHGTLKDFLQEYFGVPPTLGPERVKLEKNFNAWNLSRIAGIETEWTSNLADHLRMMDDDKKVAIFHHVSFLELQQKYVILYPSVTEQSG